MLFELFDFEIESLNIIFRMRQLFILTLQFDFKVVILIMNLLGSSVEISQHLFDLVFFANRIFKKHFDLSKHKFESLWNLLELILSNA